MTKSVINIDFRQRVRDLLAEKGVNIPHTCRLANISQQTLYNYLRQKDPENISTNTLTKVLTALETLPSLYSK